MVDFTIKAGQDKILKLVYKDSAGNFIDLTGASARMMARKGAYVAPVLDVAAIVVGVLGEITFAFVPADTETILTNTKSEKYLYDVELTKVSGEVLCILEGEVTITQPITRV